MTPTIDWYDDDFASGDIEYSIRRPGDFVVSGPIGPSTHDLGYNYPGRQFETHDDALAWAREHYGNRFLMSIIDPFDQPDRWAVLIRGNNEKATA